MGISNIGISNFKSIRELQKFEIRPINVLIGPNGAGKSNFISWFKFLNRLYDQQIQFHVNRHGRADNFLYFGSKVSTSLSGAIVFDNEYKNEYKFTMVPDQSNGLIFSEEWSNYTRPGEQKNTGTISSGGNLETRLLEDDGWRNKYLRKFFNSFRVFHFHDTSFNSPVKKWSNTTDYAFLHEDGSNLAAFLYRLAQNNNSRVNYDMIEHTVRSIAPFFNRFYLQPDEVNPNQIMVLNIHDGREGYLHRLFSRQAR